MTEFNKDKENTAPNQPHQPKVGVRPSMSNTSSRSNTPIFSVSKIPEPEWSAHDLTINQIGIDFAQFVSVVSVQIFLNSFICSNVDSANEDWETTQSR